MLPNLEDDTMTKTAPAVGTQPTETQPRGGRGESVAAVICGGLGILAAVWAFWLLVPGIALGVAAIVMGVRSRRRGSPESGSVAVALGVVALVLVPSVLVVVADAEDWGRGCALNPSNPDC